MLAYYGKLFGLASNFVIVIFLLNFFYFRFWCLESLFEAEGERAACKTYPWTHHSLYANPCHHWRATLGSTWNNQGYCWVICLSFIATFAHYLWVDLVNFIFNITEIFSLFVSLESSLSNMFAFKSCAIAVKKYLVLQLDFIFSDFFVAHY